MFVDIHRNRHDWWFGALWNKFTGLELQFGFFAVWIFPGKRDAR